jgi:hypothetical protein
MGQARPPTGRTTKADPIHPGRPLQPRDYFTSVMVEPRGPTPSGTGTLEPS